MGDQAYNCLIHFYKRVLGKVGGQPAGVNEAWGLVIRVTR